jgi:hypothetical protein
MPDLIPCNSPEHTQSSNSTPNVVLDKRIRHKLLGKFEEVGMVIVHCFFSAPVNAKIRISRSAILFDLDTGNSTRLIHALNIPVAPEWKYLKAGTLMSFTLIFAPLPEKCTLFDLVEHDRGANGLNFTGISRNKLDVYNIVIE